MTITSTRKRQVPSDVPSPAPGPAPAEPSKQANPAMEVSQRRSSIRKRIFSCFIVFLDSNCQELLLFLPCFSLVVAVAGKGEEKEADDKQNW